MVRVSTHLYLIRMGFKLQSVFRKFGNVKGYWGEVLIVLSYLLFFGYFAYWYVFKPIIIMRLDTSAGYECSPFFQELGLVFLIW